MGTKGYWLKQAKIESKDAAQKAFNSSEFQEYIKYSGIENQLSLSIIG